MLSLPKLLLLWILSWGVAGLALVYGPNEPDIMRVFCMIGPCGPSSIHGVYARMFEPGGFFHPLGLATICMLWVMVLRQLKRRVASPAAVDPDQP
jgi:hypothetical protein